MSLAKAIEQGAIGLNCLVGIVRSVRIHPVIAKSDTLIGDVDNIVTGWPELSAEEKFTPPVRKRPAGQAELAKLVMDVLLVLDVTAESAANVGPHKNSAQPKVIAFVPEETGTLLNCVGIAD